MDENAPLREEYLILTKQNLLLTEQNVLLTKQNILLTEQNVLLTKALHKKDADTAQLVKEKSSALPQIEEVSYYCQNKTLVGNCGTW